MARLSFLVRASLGSFLQKDLAGITLSLPLLCHLKSVPWACWQLSKSLLQIWHNLPSSATWSLLMYYPMIQAGGGNCFINLWVCVLSYFLSSSHNKLFFLTPKESEQHSHYTNKLLFHHFEDHLEVKAIMCCPLVAEQSDFNLPIFTCAAFQFNHPKLS